MPPRAWATTRSPPAWIPRGRWSPSGANGSSTSAWPGWATCRGEGPPRPFPPEVAVAVKALACELPATTGVPLARWHCPDLARQAAAQGIVASISGTTIWRGLSADAIKPWRAPPGVLPPRPALARQAGGGPCPDPPNRERGAERAGEYGRPPAEKAPLPPP